MKVKNTVITAMVALGLFAMLLQGCGSDSSSSDEPQELNIESMTVGDADLNAAESPENVAVDASIQVEFNTEIQSETATEENITLTQDYNDEQIPIEISVDGPVLAITPEANLGNGILYRFALSGLMNVDEQPLDQIERTFTTEGTFSPPGMIANWTFEESAEDVVGDYDPAADGVVDINYVESRNDAAGMAAQFNGNTSIIEIPNGDPLVTTEDFSIAFWVKTNSDHVNENGDPTGHFVMGIGAFYGLGFEIYGSYEAAKFGIQYEHAEGTAAEDMWFPAEATDNTNGGWQGWTYARSLTPEEMQGYLKDNWLHVTYTYHSEDKVGTLYYNGERMKSFDFNLWPEDDPKTTVTGMTYAGSEPDVINEFTFGFLHSRDGTMWDDTAWGDYDTETAQHFKGLLDDVKIYHKVLTETEIQLMYDSEE